MFITENLVMIENVIIKQVNFVLYAKVIIMIIVSIIMIIINFVIEIIEVTLITHFQKIIVAMQFIKFIIIKIKIFIKVSN